MTKRMLIDASHAEETRVVVLDGNRLEDFDIETSTKRQLKGNIYLAKVIRVEPSLQAAFVEYGGNRHGFLAFSEIHPDYYQIPVADRQRLLQMQAEEAQREQEEEDRAASERHEAVEANGVSEYESEFEREPEPEAGAPEAEAEAGVSDGAPGAQPAPSPESGAGEADLAESTALTEAAEASIPTSGETGAEIASEEIASEPIAARPAAIPIEIIQGPPERVDYSPEPAEPPPLEAPAEIEQSVPLEPSGLQTFAGPLGEPEEQSSLEQRDEIAEPLPPETMGGDHENGEDRQERRIPPRFLRNYKIQEVIRRRQILLVQVVKEERGTKGAALTTYISLAGRYCVLMPNSPRGGGVSRKITSPADRRRLKEVIAELDLPETMGLIVRTAGANRPKPEIKRDCEYLLRLWDDIREHTLRSVAPALIYEEANLIKRAIRDVYSRDIDEITVDGEDGWRAAREFMRMLMPAHVKKVQLWREPQPLFARMQVDAQLDALMSPIAQLRSGGYLVINQTEALVAIDVNSGRSTRERNVEETALRTNLEAADEVARQLRLRDLAGLIVVDFIDMESRKHNAAVEKRLKDALKSDRARIQVGHISHFGLMEMSRQRLRPSVAETNFIICPHCGGTGHLRSTESAAVHVLRGIEEEASKRRAAEVVVHVALPIAMYILNHKRDRLSAIEANYGLRVTFAGDDTLISPQFRIERVRALLPGEAPMTIRQEASRPLPSLEIDEEEEEAEAAAEAKSAAPAEEDEEDEEEAAAAPAAEAEGGAGFETAEEAEHRRRRRRRRRRGGRREEGGAEEGEFQAPAEAVPESVETEAGNVEGVPELADSAPSPEEERDQRRRPRRGRSRRRRDEIIPEIAAPGAEQPDIPPLAPYAGPTPANPFGGQSFDIFEVLEQAEEARLRTPTAAESPVEPAEATLPTVSAEPQPEPRPEPYGTAEEEPAPLPSAPEPEESAEAVSQAGQETAPSAADDVPEHLERAEQDGTGERARAAGPNGRLEETPHSEGGAETEEEPPPASPAILPILVGTEADQPAERKRGWWRR